MTRPTYQILVTVKICRGNVIEVTRQCIQVHNDYELETFTDDLNLALEGIILEVKTSLLLTGIN